MHVSIDIPIDRLNLWLADRWSDIDPHSPYPGIQSVDQFRGGFSNLTYLLILGAHRIVLRRPPVGAAVQGGHDMQREHELLSFLHPVGSLCPAPLGYCEDESIMGGPFFLMEYVPGIILRPQGLADIPSPNDMADLSRALVSQLAALHRIEVHQTGLIALGKPEGYQLRQVEGWISRYQKAKTSELAGVDQLCAWFQHHIPADERVALVHNDFKFDNLIFSSTTSPKVKAILDWEMATIGHPWMDLGTTLAYWTESGEGPILKNFNVSHLPGALTRRQVLAFYESLTGETVVSPGFYLAFGLFKVGVIAQQIHARYQRGITQDRRFASLGLVVDTCMKQAIQAAKGDLL